MACDICSHTKRAEIENALLNITSENSSVTLESIADTYGLKVEELKVHTMMHTPLGISEEAFNEGGRDSLARKIKLKEADMLSEVANEYMVTLKYLGRKIHEADDVRLLTNSACNLYLGLGGEIRGTVKCMTELDTALNGNR